MKSKIWSILAVAFAVICFVLSLVGFFVAAIGGKTDITAVALEVYLINIIALLLGIACMVCASKRTAWRVHLVSGMSSLAKMGMMLNIIVIAAELIAA